MMTSDANLYDRYKELMSKKKKVAKKMEGLKKKYVTAKIEKKRISQEIAHIARELKHLHATNPQAAKDKMLKELTTFSPEDLFPPDLEKEFDELELTRNKRDEKMVELHDYIVDGDSVVSNPPNDEEDLELQEKPAQASSEEDVEDLDREMRERLALETEVGFDEADIIVGEHGEKPISDDDIDAD
jgi:chromosome segregation ATPase